MEPISATIVTYVALSIVDQVESDIKSSLFGKVKEFFFPKQKYQDRLRELIYQTTEEHQVLFPFSDSGNRFPFYQSQILFKELSKHVLFKSQTPEGLVQLFQENPNILIPSEQELNEYFTRFVNHINNDKLLKRLHLEENYKNEIFEISNSLKSLSDKLDSINSKVGFVSNYIAEKKEIEDARKLTSAKAFESLSKQVKRQLKKQLNSGKYLPDTFIETTTSKEHLRFMVDPLLYINKFFDEVNVLDFRLLNKRLRENGDAEFDLDWDQFQSELKALNVENYNDFLLRLEQHLLDKEKLIKDEEDRRNDYSSWIFQKKFRAPKESLKFFKTRVVLITESAGQGKTNFLCDFSDKFLNGKGIPHVFLTGVELNEKDIRSGILKSIFPDNSNLEFSDFLEVVRKLCLNEGKFFTIVIDGINENANTKTLSQNLEIFIGEILEHDFIKLVITCRTEYFDHNFSNLLKSSFSNELERIDSLMSTRPHPEEDIQEKLLWTYFTYFEIKTDGLSPKAYRQLISNFLLLRIFCETYRGENLGNIDDIYKEELFERYYSIKVEEINTRWNQSDEFQVIGKIDIKKFIARIIRYMVDNKTYVNVPLDTILEEGDNKEVYVRFLDENILIKRDPIENEESEVFGYSEVVNFTFDEFRDYLISAYLVHELYMNNEHEFKSFLEEGITERSPILEGCSTFLFFEARKPEKDGLSLLLQEQNWYDSVFKRCVFALKDQTVTDNEIQKVIELIRNSSGSTNLIFNLILRNDTDTYKRLNIRTLIDLLLDLNKEQFDNSFASVFGDRYSGGVKINQEQLLSRLEEVLDNNELLEQPKYHNTFELLLYLFTNRSSWRVRQVYEMYYYRYPERSKKQLLRAKESKNEALLAEIMLFITEYDIEL